MNPDTLRDIETLRSWIEACGPRKMVFFGGAGVSTESGIPDFRSADGLYSQGYTYPPEAVVSRTFFEARPKDFYDFYCTRMVDLDAKPNRAHRKLAELERAGRLKAVVTQNIDGLHQKAGSRTVYELHGSVLRNYCMKCRQFYGADFMVEARGVPRCPVCGGIVKPDVVLYEEQLDQETLEASVLAISRADMLIVGGTSLVVYPAAGLINYYRGDKLVLINRDATPYDRRADLVIHDAIGKVLGGIKT